MAFCKHKVNFSYLWRSSRIRHSKNYIIFFLSQILLNSCKLLAVANSCKRLRPYKRSTRYTSKFYFDNCNNKKSRKQFSEYTNSQRNRLACWKGVNLARWQCYYPGQDSVPRLFSTMLSLRCNFSPRCTVVTLLFETVNLRPSLRRLSSSKCPP